MRLSVPIASLGSMPCIESWCHLLVSLLSGQSSGQILLVVVEVNVVDVGLDARGSIYVDSRLASRSIAEANDSTHWTIVRRFPKYSTMKMAVCSNELDSPPAARAAHKTDSSR